MAENKRKVKKFFQNASQRQGLNVTRMRRRFGFRSLWSFIPLPNGPQRVKYFVLIELF